MKPVEDPYVLYQITYLDTFWIKLHNMPRAQ